MINQDWWFTTLLVKQFQYCPPLSSDIKCDVLVIESTFGLPIFSFPSDAENHEAMVAFARSVA